jgi:hypothetical protein
MIIASGAAELQLNPGKIGIQEVHFILGNRSRFTNHRLEKLESIVLFGEPLTKRQASAFS